MAVGLRRAGFRGTIGVRAVLVLAFGVGTWLLGSQSAAALAPGAVAGTPHQAGLGVAANGSQGTVQEGTPVPGEAVGPIGPRGFATASGDSYSCGYQSCFLAGFSGVSCATAASCTAVGTALGSATLAEGWDGAAWTIEPTAVPSGSTSSTLASVSCTAATACLAVGSYFHYDSSGSGTYVPLAELWDGASWTIRPPPTPPDAAGNTVLSYVQCAAANACMAVGSYASSTSGEQAPLAEFWDGSTWTVQAAPLPSGATIGQLLGVSCPSVTACTAVGQYWAVASGQRTLAESWNGTSWTIQPTPTPAGSALPALNAVWCESPTSCTAVGGYYIDNNFALTRTETLAESWNGVSWTIQATPNPDSSANGTNTLANVSCARAGVPCVAVGSTGAATLSESWDGTTWSVQPTPTPANSTDSSSFSDVSCTSATACTAVGQYFNSVEGPTGSYVTRAERWDGTTWTTQQARDPALAVNGSASNIASSSSATLNGTVYPGGAPTTCYFQYGTTTSLGSTIPCAQPAGAGTAPVAVSADITGLSPNTTYYFSLVATNAGGGMTYDATGFESTGPSSLTTNASTGGGGPQPPPPPSRSGIYVAMGDSYSAGEGTASYDDGTDTLTDHCHRSSHDLSHASYPPVLVRDSPLVPSRLLFVACSGATIYQVEHGRDGESPQMAWLKAAGAAVRLVTISVGGDDLGFPSVVENCVNAGPVHFRSDATCQGQEKTLHTTMYGDPTRLRDPLIQLYRKIRAYAPNARILVMGYPHLFPLTGENSCGVPGLRYIDSSDINWLDKMATELDGYLAATVAESGVAQYVSTFDAMTDSGGNDHSACGNNAPWINELQLFHPFPWAYSSESFHPNADGYVAFEETMLAAIDGPPPGLPLLLNPGQTITQALTVGPITPLGTGTLTVSTSWPGSTVTTSLVSPTGRVIDATTRAADVSHLAGATYEVYTITNPTRGTWHVRIVGTSVSQGGELVRLQTQVVKAIHPPPLARIAARPRRGTAPLRVLFSASGSRALQGHLRSVIWNFGDGTHGRGRRVRHTYKRSGTYGVRATVVDSAGASTYASTVVDVGPFAAVKPGRAVDLGTVRIGRPARKQRFTVRNPGRTPFTIRRIVAIAGTKQDLRLSSSRCIQRRLTRRHACTFTATLVASAAGLRWAEVAIIANTGIVGHTVLFAQAK